MKTTPFAPRDFLASVLAVPPLARNPDLSLSREGNKAVVDHLIRGGVTSLLYGGNANLYHIGLSDYAEMLELLVDLAPENAWVIPSAGPEFGRLQDQAVLLKPYDFPLVMVLPCDFPASPDGTLRSVSAFAEALGRPVMLYVKSERILSVDLIGSLFDRGVVVAVKYAVARAEATQDPMLSALSERIGAERIVSGFGERPAIDHLRTFGLAGYTAGSVCLAPALSTALLRACQHGRFDQAELLRATFLPFEDQRDSIDPIGVLHYALDWAGVAPTGPILPALSAPAARYREAIEASARQLVAADLAFMEALAA